jgi:hypothetical protein
MSLGDRCRAIHEAVDGVIMAVRAEAEIEFDCGDRAHLQFVLGVDDLGFLRDRERARREARAHLASYRRSVRDGDDGWRMPGQDRFWAAVVGLPLPANRAMPGRVVP